jgi:multiple sugar transport system permease protein
MTITKARSRQVAATKPTVRRRRRWRVRPGRAAAWTLLAILVFVSLFPFWWMFKEALTHNKYLFGDFGLWPQHPTLVNFKRVLGLATPAQQQAEFPNEVIQLQFLSNLLNSVIFTAVVAVGSVAFSSLSAFAFARLHWRGRDLLFGAFLAALMVPPIFGVLPNFILMKELNWIYSWKGLIAPYLLMQPFAVFFLRQFFLNIPDEIEDAGRLDGLGPWGLYRRICLPMSSAPIATLLTIQAVFAWNEYLWPQLITTSGHAQPLTAALGFFVRSSPTVARDWTAFMAATTVSVVPLVIFMLLFGRRLVTNLRFAGGGK